MTTSFEVLSPKNLAIYSDLMQLGRPGHEKLIFSPKDMTPVTAKKPSFWGRVIGYFYKPINQRIQTVVDNTLKFFEENKDLSKPRSNCLQVLSPVIYKTKNQKLIDRYIALVIEQNKADQCANEDKKAQYDQEAELYQQEKRQEIEKIKDESERAIELLESEFLKTRKFLEVEYQKPIMLLEETKRKKERKIEELKEIQKREIQAWDTVLKGKDGSVIVPWSLFERQHVQFFSIEDLQNQRKDFLKNHPGKRFEVDFKKFSEKSLRSLVGFLRTISIPQDLDKGSLLELFALADYMNNRLLKLAVKGALVHCLTEDDAKEILASSDLAIDGILAQTAQEVLDRADREINEEDISFLMREIKVETQMFSFSPSSNTFNQFAGNRIFNVKPEWNENNQLKIDIQHNPHDLMKKRKK